MGLPRLTAAPKDTFPLRWDKLSSGVGRVVEGDPSRKTERASKSLPRPPDAAKGVE